jgi:hypothetical protein
VASSFSHFPTTSSLMCSVWVRTFLSWVVFAGLLPVLLLRSTLPPSLLRLNWDLEAVFSQNSGLYLLSEGRFCDAVGVGSYTLQFLSPGLSVPPWSWCLGWHPQWCRICRSAFTPANQKLVGCWWSLDYCATSSNFLSSSWAVIVWLFQFHIAEKLEGAACF